MKERMGVWKEWRKEGRKEGLAIWLLDFFIVWCFKQAQKLDYCQFNIHGSVHRSMTQ
jgi:hypothetical protein